MSDIEKKSDRPPLSHARINLGHTGGHLKTKDWLAFQSDFAQAQDAVMSAFSISEIEKICRGLNLTTVEVASKPADIVEYLLRPDLGKLIADNSRRELEAIIKKQPEICYRDMLIVISGGLSPIAVERQIPIFLPLLIDKLRIEQLSIAPICINPRGRVALGDSLNEYLQAKMVVMLIGERPGLSAADSMGIYFTYQAKPGYTDASRNCISNIHARGIPAVDALDKLVYLLKKSLALGVSGIMLKDDQS
jgi:ethanolamine ammonia-lyase small subunit